jgi:hypothetical protein
MQNLGDTLRWTISLNGHAIDEQSDRLDEELKAGYAFFIQSWYENYSEAKKDDEE